MALRITVVVLSASALSYWHIVSTLEEQTSDSLMKYISQRGEKESAIFKLAEDNEQVFKERFLDAYARQTDVSDADFWSIFERKADGTTRLKKKAFDGYRHADGTISYGTTAYIGPEAPMGDQEFRNRLYLTYKLVDRFSDAWTTRFANVYASMPENVNIVHWPDLPWADNAEASLDVTTEEWVYITTPENNPERAPAWTGLYYDPTADRWMVSLETPVDYDGRHILNVGHDILLNDLFDRVYNDKLKGSHNMILRSDGRLVANQTHEADIRKALGVVDIDDLGDPKLSNLYHQIQDTVKTGDQGAFVVKNDANDAMVAVTEIHGPDWYFVTLYPMHLVTSSAKKAAEFILILGAISLVIELAMLYALMRKKILSPLDLFRMALVNINEGRFQTVANGNTPLPEDHDNEIGDIAVTLRSMAGSIETYSRQMEDQREELEDKVRQRTLELVAAKQKAEALARVDELTQIPNRRSFTEIFSRELAQAQRDQRPICLALIDIDHFKHTNDRYGHTCGDEALKAIAAALRSGVREGDLVARVGGEEFAVIFVNADTESALSVMERIRSSIAHMTVKTADHELKLTISAGLTCCAGSYNFEAAYTAADAALYCAKNDGRNRVCTAAAEIPAA